MIRPFPLATLTLLVVPATLSTGTDQPVSGTTPETVVRTPSETTVENAALLYYRYWLGMGDDLREALYEEYSSDPDWRPSPKLSQIISEHPDVIRGLLKATTVEHCDWGVETEEGIYALLPHLSELRRSARLLRADARRLLDADEIEAASERVAALYRLSAHAASDPVLISSLVSVAILHLAGREVEEIVATGSLTTTARDTMLKAIDTLDPEDPGHIRRGILEERSVFLGWFQRTFRGPDAPRRMLAMLEDIGSPPTPEDREALIAMSEQDLVADFEQAARFFDAVDSIWYEPDALDRAAQIDELVERGHYGISGKILLPGVTKVYQQAMDSAEELRRIRRLLETAQVIPPTP